MPQTIVPTEMRFDARYEKHNAVGNNDSTAKKATIEFERQWLSKNKTKKIKFSYLTTIKPKYLQLHWRRLKSETVGLHLSSRIKVPAPHLPDFIPSRCQADLHLSGITEKPFFLEKKSKINIKI